MLDMNSELGRMILTGIGFVLLSTFIIITALLFGTGPLAVPSYMMMTVLYFWRGRQWVLDAYYP